MPVNHITDDSFEQAVVNAEVPVVVDYWAEWCAPCREIAPALEEIATELAGRDENPQTPGKFGVRGIPTLMLFKGGEVASTKIGALPKGKIKAWIEAAI